MQQSRKLLTGHDADCVSVYLDFSIHGIPAVRQWTGLAGVNRFQPGRIEDKEVPEPRPENTETTAGLASPIIVYADLIATGDPRNLETAQRLRDVYITEPDGTA